MDSLLAVNLLNISTVLFLQPSDIHPEYLCYASQVPCLTAPSEFAVFSHQHRHVIRNPARIWSDRSYKACLFTFWNICVHSGPITRCISYIHIEPGKLHSYSCSRLDTSEPQEDWEVRTDRRVDRFNNSDYNVYQDPNIDDHQPLCLIEATSNIRIHQWHAPNIPSTSHAKPPCIYHSVLRQHKLAPFATACNMWA